MAGPYDDLITQTATQAGIDPQLLRAVVQTESSGNPRAVSPKGAMGLTQLMPDTARQFGVQNPFDPGENLRAGATYLRQLLDQYGGDTNKALAHYNGGPGAVTKPPAETRAYVAKVNNFMGQSGAGSSQGSTAELLDDPQFTGATFEQKRQVLSALSPDFARMDRTSQNNAIFDIQGVINQRNSNSPAAVRQSQPPSTFQRVMAIPREAVHGFFGGLGVPETGVQDIPKAVNQTMTPTQIAGLPIPGGAVGRTVAALTPGVQTFNAAYGIGQGMNQTEQAAINLARNPTLENAAEVAHGYGQTAGTQAGLILGEKLASPEGIGIQQGLNRFANAPSNPNALYHSYLDPVANQVSKVPTAPTSVMRAVLKDMVDANEITPTRSMEIKASQKATLGEQDSMRMAANRLSKSVYEQPGRYSAGMAKGAAQFAGDLRENIFPQMEDAHGLAPGSMRQIKALQGQAMQMERNPSLTRRVVRSAIGGGGGAAIGYHLAGPEGAAAGGALGVAAVDPAIRAAEGATLNLRARALGARLGPPAQAVIVRDPITGRMQRVFVPSGEETGGPAGGRFRTLNGVNYEVHQNEPVAISTEPQDVPMSSIHANPEALQRAAQRAKGFPTGANYPPITVMPDGKGGFLLQDGYHRYSVMLRNPQQTVKAYIQLDPETSFRMR